MRTTYQSKFMDPAISASYGSVPVLGMHQIFDQVEYLSGLFEKAE